MQKAAMNMEYITKLLVTQVAKLLSMHLFMGGDYVIRKEITLCQSMYATPRRNRPFRPEFRPNFADGLPAPRSLRCAQRTRLSTAL